MAKLMDTARHWHDRAEEMRTAAAKMRDPEARRIALGIAEGYKLLAKCVEERAAAPRRRRPAGTAFRVEVGGTVHRGRFEVTGGVITVRSGVWQHVKPLGDHADDPKALAKMILVQAVRKAKP